MEDSHTDPHPYVGSVPVKSEYQIADVGTQRSEDPKLISCEIIFEVFQPM